MITYPGLTNQISGNTAGATAYLSTGTVVIAGGNNITLSQNGNSVTISGPNTAVQSTQPVAASASNGSFNFSTLKFVETNGVTWATSTDGIRASVKTDYLTTAALSNAVVNSINGSTGEFTFNTGSSLSSSRNGNSITWGLASNITTALQSTGAYLTTAALSNHSHGVSFTSGSTVFQTLSFTNSNGFSFNSGTQGVFGSYTVPTVTNSSFSVQDSATTINPVNRIAFSTGNNITLSLSTGASSATVGVQHNLAGTSSGFGGNLISGSMTHNSSGLNLSLNHPAWLTTAALSGDTTKYIQNWKITGNTAGTTSSAQGTDLWLAGGNGLTISGSSNSLSFSVNTSYRASNDAIGLNTAQTNVTWTVNSSGLSINAAGYAGTGLSLTNATATLNSNGLQLSVAGGGTTNQTGPNIAAGTQTGTSGTIVFANSNNITFGMSGSTQVTASFNHIDIGISNIGNTAGTTGTFDGAGLQYVLAGGSGITLSQSSNANSVTLSIHGGNVLSEFMPYQQLPVVTNSSNAFGNSSIYFVPFDIHQSLYVDRVNVFHSLATTSSNASAITGSISYMVGLYERQTGTNSSRVTLLTSNEAYIGFSLSATSVSIIIPDGRNSNSITYYTYNNASAASQVTTAVRDLLAGPRAFQIPIMSTMSPGHYWLGYGMKSTHGTGSASWNLRASQHYQSISGMGYMPYGSTYTSLASNNATARPPMAGMGSFSAQSAAMPNSAALNGTDIKFGTAMLIPLFNLSGWTTNASNL